MSEMLMTETAATTTEGSSASQSDANAQANTSQTQQADGAQNQQTTTNSDGKSGQNDATKGAQGAPESYEFKPPEGHEFDQKVLGVYKDVAKELNLSQDAAQKILEKMTPAMQAQRMEQMSQIKTEWAGKASADPEYGGENLQQNLGLARKALDAFGTPELRSLLNESGLGNHPEVIRFMYRSGKAISGDRFVGGSQGNKGKPQSQSDYANSLYPSQQ